MNIKNCGCRNVRKHREVNNGVKYITFDIYLEFSSLDRMKITYSDPKDYLVRPEKGLINSMVLKTNIRSKKNKKARYVITNVSMKELSNIIKEFEKLPYTGCVWKRPKH